MVKSDWVPYVILVAFFLGVTDQQGPHPIFPPYGCANYGGCRSILSTGTTANDYYYCRNTSYCVCNNGTSGSNCTTVANNCASSPCPTNGNFTCTNLIDNYNCECAPGFCGDNCDTAISSSCASSPCMNGGTCESTGNDTYTCNCRNRWLGEVCQYENTCYLKTDGCANGVCTMLFHNEAYYCKCNPGWQGPKCGQQETFTNESSLGCFIMDESILSALSDQKISLGSQPKATDCKNYFYNRMYNVDPPYDTYIVIGNECYLTVGNPFNETSTPQSDYANNYCNAQCRDSASGNNNNKNYNGNDQICGRRDKRRGIVSSVMLYDEEKQCETANCTNGGQCIESTGSASCICPRGFMGADCNETYAPCDSNPCGAGNNCTDFLVTMTYECKCNNKNTGQNCDKVMQCSSSPCLNGGKCIELDNDFECECLSLYTGKTCDAPNYCNSNPCKNGACNPTGSGLKAAYKCTCDPGWNGTTCTVDVKECNSSPCLYGGTCTEIIPPAEPFFTCECVSGTQGEYCETNPDDCEYSNENWVTYSTCNKSDSQAQCIDGLNSYTCQCGPDFTGQFCEIEMLIYDVLIQIFGGIDDQMLNLMQELLGNPAMIKDMVPFILGLKTDAERQEMSWDFDDLFLWATYEEKTLEVDVDLLKWNDVTLGNCFTFNHRNNTERIYEKRMSGVMGGFYTLMRINQDEYFPWVDTEAILVFIHPAEEDIFSESVRYNAEPNGQTELFPALTEYGRLGGQYGKCINEPNEVKAYYYTGAYTTDGCLRSCYQNAVCDACGCMDPRYPMPPDKTPCDLTTRSCVENVANTKGDPSTWDDCVCPLPCENSQYFVSLSRTIYANEPTECGLITDPDLKTNCTRSFQDTVLIQVAFAGMDYQFFEETPAMDFNRFISNLGGLLGVLMGVSIISFIEIAFLIFTCWRIFFTHKKP